MSSQNKNQSISFRKNLLLVQDNSMHPYVKKGDLVIYEDIKPNYPFGSSVYIIKYNGEESVRRIQFLVKGGINIIADNGKVVEKVEQNDLSKVIFMGHVIGRICDGEIIKGYRMFADEKEIY